MTTEESPPPAPAPAPVPAPAPAATPAQAPAPGPAPAGRRGKGYFLPGFIALVALLVIGVVIAGAGDLGHSAPRTLDTSAVASQISLSIQENRNTSIPVLVACPSQEPIKLGFQFDCSLSGVPQKVVHVTEVDNRGEVRWSLGP